jgi:hypothetical protein
MLLTGDVEKGPDTGNKDEKVLQRPSLGYKAQDANNEHSEGADHCGKDDDESAAVSVSKEDE